MNSYECHQEASRMPMRSLDDQIRVIVHRQHAASREPLIGLIRARLDRDLTTNAVRPTDPPDDDAHA